MVEESKKGVSLLFKTREELMPKNLAGLYFDIIQEHDVVVQNTITDNWIENNTAISDHIAHQPIIVTLRGISGELVFTPPTQTLDAAYKFVNTAIQDRFSDGVMANNKLLTDKLLVIPALIPSVDNITQLAKNAVSYLESNYERYDKIVRNFTTDNRESRLWQIYQDLIDISNSNTPMLVETPYSAFDNMYIQSINFRQGNNLFATDIVLTLKQVYFADTLTTKADEKVLAQYNQFQRATVENHGKTQGVNTNETMWYSLWGNPNNLPVKIRG